MVWWQNTPHLLGASHSGSSGHAECISEYVFYE